MTVMSCNGYDALVEFDADAGLFHGEVLALRDVVTFQGRSVDELRVAFAESLNDYIDFCQSRGERPETPYSGQFMIRVAPRLHRALAEAARQDGVSLDEWVARALATAGRAVQAHGATPPIPAP